MQLAGPPVSRFQGGFVHASGAPAGMRRRLGLARTVASALTRGLPHGGPSVAASDFFMRLLKSKSFQSRRRNLKASYDPNWEITVSLYQNLCVKTVCCKLARIQGQSQSKTILDGRVSESLATF